MKILVIGSGGREHALVWKLAQSTRVEKIFAIPGNPGISELAECVEIKISENQKIIEFVKENNIELTVVGPEIPLMNGIVDDFEKEGLLIFGPKKSAAMLEGSKAFAKDFMRRNSIPTANYEVFGKSQKNEAILFLQNQIFPVVIKADGLASGKGVVICDSLEEANNTIEEYFGKNIFGEAGNRIVIEEFMKGEEASIFVLTDGEKYFILPSAQDHKKILDCETGKNTGGMGAYSPAFCVTNEILKNVELKIIVPTLQAMKFEGNLYRGCLYVGLMLTSDGPKVVEYNSRFGDPETQVVLPICDFDLAEILLQCTEGNLKNVPNFQVTKNAICVVCASNGYPESFETGKEIIGLGQFTTQDKISIFQSGTKFEGGKLLTNGGRVLGVTAICEGNNFAKTFELVYSAVSKINFEGIYFRKDIAKRAIT